MNVKRGSPAAYAISLLVVGSAIVVLDSVPAITARAVVPVLLLVVILVARTCGTGPGVLASLTASVGYALDFLPAGGLHLEEEWLSLLTFAGSAILVGELAARAELRRVEALAGREEIERLYQMLRDAFEGESEAEASRRNERMKATLLDALRHNLGTPLTSIKAAVTALLAERHGGGGAALPDESRLELLQVIDEEADRLQRFSVGLSTTGAAPVGSHSSSVSEIIQLATTRASALTRRFRVTVNIEKDLPALNVDQAAVAEVVYMLIDNATKYAEPGGEIQINASREGRSHAYIEVVDQGPGIPARFREQVFERFFRIQGRDPIDPNRTGLGIGLSIARRLVETQGGRIWVETPSARIGTAVIMMLPLSETQAHEMPTPASVAS